MSVQGEGDKRKVSTDALESLGTIIDANQKRDAIHLAVEPVVAAEDLEPGAHITVKNGRACLAARSRCFGIVDPFLTRTVREGERFWFVMYPRMVHSLRHVWTHPAFPDEPTIKPSPASVEASEAWLRNFCAHADCPDYETVIAVASGQDVEPVDGYGRHYRDRNYLHFSGHDAHGEIPPEFWIHVEIVTGVSIPPDLRSDHFSCSC